MSASNPWPGTGVGTGVGVPVGVAVAVGVGVAVGVAVGVGVGVAVAVGVGVAVGFGVGDLAGRTREERAVKPSPRHERPGASPVVSPNINVRGAADSAAGGFG